MTGHATQRWQRSYARFSWTPQARRWIYPWDVFRRCSTLQFLMKSGRLTCRMHSASSPKFFAAIHSRRVHAIVSTGSLGVFYWWSAVFKSNMAGVQMCPVIWVKWGEAYKQHTKEFARLMCGTRKLEMYNLMLPRWMWHAVWTTENMYRVFRCVHRVPGLVNCWPASCTCIQVQGVFVFLGLYLLWLLRKGQRYGDPCMFWDTFKSIEESVQVELSLSGVLILRWRARLRIRSVTLWEWEGVSQNCFCANLRSCFGLF